MQTNQELEHQQERKEQVVGIRSLPWRRAHQLEVLVPQPPILLSEHLQLPLDGLPSRILHLLGMVHGLILLPDKLADRPQPEEDPPQKIVLSG